VPATPPDYRQEPALVPLAVRAVTPVQQAAGPSPPHDSRSLSISRDLGQFGAIRPIWMLSSPSCSGCTTHTGCEAIPDTSVLTCDEAFTVLSRQLGAGTDPIQSHGAGNATTSVASPVPYPGCLGSWLSADAESDACSEAVGCTPLMDVNTPRVSLPPHAIVHDHHFPLFSPPAKHPRILINIKFSYLGQSECATEYRRKCSYPTNEETLYRSPSKTN